MPLDNTRKVQHIQTVVNRSFQGRQRTVVFVTLAVGVYSYTTVQVIMRRSSFLIRRSRMPVGTLP